MAGENISPGDAHRRLRRVYILVSNSTEALEFQRISPAESLIEMVKHAFLPDIEAQAMLAARFVPAALKPVSRVTTMLSRPGSGLPIEV